MSRQEQAFNYFSETFIKLIERARDVPHKEIVLAWWTDFFEHEGIKNNMVQAFSNFMWSMDRKIELGVALELGNIVSMISQTAAAQTDQGKVIIESILDIIESNDTPQKEMDNKEIDSLINDDEVDNSPLDLKL